MRKGSKTDPVLCSLAATSRSFSRCHTSGSCTPAESELAYTTVPATLACRGVLEGEQYRALQAAFAKNQNLPKTMEKSSHNADPVAAATKA